jgi:uncharacterized damage-inducible protein DinB
MRAKIQSVLETWEREYVTTFEVLSVVPEGRNDQTVVPGKGWTMGSLIWHICISERWFCVDIIGAEPAAENPVPADRQPDTVAEMMASFHISHAALIEVVASKDDAWFDEVVDFYGNPWTRLDLLHLMFRHEVHHRGQLSMLMMVAGGLPPTIYGAPGINIEDAG